jgi:hypothetical protein
VPIRQHHRTGYRVHRPIRGRRRFHVHAKWSELALADSQESALFVRVAGLGKEFEAGLLALLFDDPELRRWVREYLMF